MKRSLLCSVLFAFTLILITSCSGDDSSTPTQNVDTSQLLGKWIIYKAQYGDSEPVQYESNGSCGKEVLDFYPNGEVSEMVYVDSDCMNGAGGSYNWWVQDNGTIVIGYENSIHHTITVSDDNLIFDATENGNFIKYYHKAN